MIAGENFNLLDKKNILKIRSPKNYVAGPYIVVYVDIENRWAIVALDWEENPCLAIRWFYGTGGQPFSRQSTWLVIPDQLNTAILNTLPISSVNRKLLDDFLIGQKSGEELKTEYKD